MVVNLKDERCDIKIDRTTKWGNPYRISKTLSRQRAIELYRLWLAEEILAGRITRQDFIALKGKRLGCWCKPLSCHGDILVDVVNRLSIVN